VTDALFWLVLIAAGSLALWYLLIVFAVEVAS